jgi:hypothetical protein
MAEQFQCGDFEDLAVLYAVDELDAAQRAAVERHAAGCAACAAVLGRELRMRAAIAVRGERADEVDRSGLLLAQCRSELAESLDDAEKRSAKPWWHNAGSPGLWASVFGRALAFHPGRSTAALLVAGALAGLGGRAWYQEASLPMPARPLMTVSAAPPISDQDLENMGVEGIHVDSQAGEAPPRVEVQMLSRRPIMMSGSPNDVEIGRVLTYVLAHPQRFDPDVRLDSLDALRSQTSDPQVRGALVQAARRDDDPAVRLKALEALRGARNDGDVLQTMLDALAGDDNSGVRIEAVNGLLDSLGGPNAPARALGAGAMGILRDRMQNDPNQYIRSQSATALERLASFETDAARPPRFTPHP